MAVAGELRQGLDVDGGRLAELRARDERLRAQVTALGLLARRARSCADVRSRLLERGFGQDAVEATVSALVGARLLDDEAYARHHVEVRSAQPRSRRLHQLELRRDGVEESIAVQAVASVDDRAAAEAAARGRLKGLRGVPRDVFYRRLGGFLQRRGFGYDIAAEVLSKLWTEVRAEAESEPG